MARVRHVPIELGQTDEDDDLHPKILLGVRLSIGVGVRERGQGGASRLDRSQPRPTQLHGEPPGIRHLGNQADVGERGLVAEGERVRLAGDQGLQGVESTRDHVPGPGLRLFRRLASRLQRLQDLEILKGVDVAGDGLGEGPHPGPCDRIGREKRRLGTDLIQILADRQGLRQHRAVIQDQAGQQALRVDGEVLCRPLLALAKVLISWLGAQPLQVERDRTRQAADERK